MFRNRYEVPPEHRDDIGNWHFYYYYEAFVQTRIAWFRSLGITPERLRDDDISIVVGSEQCSRSMPIQRDDTPIIEVHTERIGRSSITLGYSVYRESDLLECAKGSIVHICISRSTRKSVELPLSLRVLL